MKQYGARYATEFTKKQINVIFAKAKAGEIRIEKGCMADLYDMAEYYGYDSNRGVARAEFKIMKILEAVFSGDIEKAQELIDEYSEATYSLLGKKGKERWSKELVA